MSIWEKYSKEQQEEYKKFLKVYGSLSNLFRQKHGEPIPYLDSKFQETIYAKVFNSQNVDIGNTPHDVLSIFESARIGIGLKTWMNSVASYQKVMQLKRYRDDINAFSDDPEALVYKISSIKNERMRSDYFRLGLSEDLNIYHYITRDAGKLVIQECAYPLVELNNLQNIEMSSTSVVWDDGIKKYKYTFSDSQIWQYFDSNARDSTIIDVITIDIMDDPFSFLVDSYDAKYSESNRLENIINSAISSNESTKNLSFYIKDKEIDIWQEAYLPLYSYTSKEVELKSGLNAWNAAPKNKKSTAPRPLNEVYIPIPRAFHHKCSNFFHKNIFAFEEAQKDYTGSPKSKPEIRFTLVLPNGKEIPALVTQAGHKSLQSGSLDEIDPTTGKVYGQSALGQWLLVDVLGLDERVPVTRQWLNKKGIDSVRLWHKRGDYRRIYIDIAPFNAFENFMNDTQTDDDLET